MIHQRQAHASYNSVDRHVEAGNGDKVALRWIGEPVDDQRDITYAQTPGRGVPGRQRADRPRCRQGDRVAIYMPKILEANVAMLACARIGALHAVVLGGSADARASRIDDCQAKLSSTSCGSLTASFRLMAPFARAWSPEPIHDQAA